MKYLLLGLCLTYALHLSVNYYRQNSEIKGFSYAALMVNIDKYPNDKAFINQINNALSDNSISGNEHKAIVERLLDKHGVYVGAKMDRDHSKAKKELILVLKSRVAT